MKKSKKVLVAAGFALAMVFTISCSDGGGDDSGLSSGGGINFDENSQIYNYNDGSSYTGDGIIEICGDDGCLRSGSVTNGIVNLELPISIPDGYLRVDDNSGCSGSLKDVKVFYGEFQLKPNMNDLNIRYRDKQIREDIVYHYYAKAGKLTCNLKEPWEMVANIEAKSGWNKVYSRRIYDGEGNTMTMEFSTKNILTNEVKWLMY